LWMPAMKPTDGSCGVLGVLVVWTVPLASSKATTSVNVPPVSNASRNRATGPQRTSGDQRDVAAALAPKRTSAQSARRRRRRRQRHQARHPAFHAFGRADVDPLTAAGDAATFEHVQNQPLTQCGDRSTGHGLGA